MPQETKLNKPTSVTWEPDPEGWFVWEHRGELMCKVLDTFELPGADYEPLDVVRVSIVSIFKDVVRVRPKGWRPE